MYLPLSQNQAKFIRSLQIKKYREKENAFWIEGVRLCEGALNASTNIEYAVIAADFQSGERNKKLLQRIAGKNIPLYQIQESFSSLSDTESPQGIGFVVKQSGHIPDFNSTRNLLVTDGIQDPGNMGTIIRSAEWFGFDAIITGSNSVDVFNPKVVRSTMGALFNIHILEKTKLTDTIDELKSLGYSIIGSVLDNDATTELNPVPGKCCLIIGSEAHGISKALYPYLDKKISIPGSGKSESLNAAVAAGILMYNLYQKTNDHGRI